MDRQTCDAAKGSLSDYAFTLADGAAAAWDDAPEAFKPILKECSDTLLHCHHELDAQLAILATLPKTTDGKFIYPGVELWYRSPLGSVPVTNVDDWEDVWLVVGDIQDGCKIYSSKAEAEKAKD